MSFQADAVKGKAAAKGPPVGSSDGEDDATHQSGLEYDEQLSIEESDDTGSEFQASEEDESQSDMAHDSDQEAVMLSVAVERSLQPLRQANASANGAGSSRPAPAPARSSVASTRTKAAKGRRPRNYVLNSPNGMSDSGRDTPFISSDEEPISKTKGKKKKAKAKKSVAKVQDASKTNEDWEDSLGEKLRRTIQERRRIKQEELALRRKLGRKLTTVNILSISPYAKLMLPSRPKKLQSRCIHNIPN